MKIKTVITISFFAFLTSVSLFFTGCNTVQVWEDIQSIGTPPSEERQVTVVKTTEVHPE